MKKLIGLLSASLMLFSCNSIAQKYDENEKPYMTKTYVSDDLSNLKVETSGGGITVTGQSGNEAKIEVYIRPNNWNGRTLDKEEIEERLQKYVLTIKKEGNTLIASARRKDSNWNDWKNALNIGFKVYVPSKISSDVRTSGGGITMKNLAGVQRFSTSGGGLTLTNLSGDSKGSTSGGGIKITNCKDKLDVSTSGGGIDANNSEGEIRLSTSGGGLRLTNLKGNIKATTSGGGVRADDIKGDLVTHTSGGSIHIDDMDGSLNASTSGGGIDVNMKSLGKFLTLSTSAGGIHVNMPMNQGMDLDLDGNRVKVPTLANFNGTIEKDRVRGKLNGGGIPVKMDSNAGGVYINE